MNTNYQKVCNNIKNIEYQLYYLNHIDYLLNDINYLQKRNEYYDYHYGPNPYIHPFDMILIDFHNDLMMNPVSLNYYVNKILNENDFKNSNKVMNLEKNIIDNNNIVNNNLNKKSNIEILNNIVNEKKNEKNKIDDIIDDIIDNNYEENMNLYKNNKELSKKNRREKKRLRVLEEKEKEEECFIEKKQLKYSLREFLKIHAIMKINKLLPDKIDVWKYHENLSKLRLNK